MSGFSSLNFFNASNPSEASMTPVPVTTYAGIETQPSFSPDGNQVAFAS
jgi:Tol biopolymer transport system component